MWKVYICDDEKSAIEDIKNHLLEVIKEKYSGEDFQIVTYNTGVMLLGDIEEGRVQPDMIFMDIKLAEGSGIKTARNVLKFLPSCQIIFVSGYDDYYLDVYEVEHIYFVKKPLDNIYIADAMKKAMERIDRSRDEIFGFTSKSKMTLLPLKQILYFEKEKRKILVYTIDGKCHEYYGKMDELMSQLNNSFVRCHNSYVVNIGKIMGMDRDKFIMGDNSEIPISRMYYKPAKERFLDHIENTF